MKYLIKSIFILIFLIFFSQKSESQNELNFDNNITGIYSRSNSENLDFSFIGSNFFTSKKITITSNTIYSSSLNSQSTNKLNSSELMQKISFDYQSKNIYKFIFYQYNSSLQRNINSENWIGLGLGIKKKIKNSTFNFSYALMSSITNVDYFLRHSFKFKYRIEKKLFSFNTEYSYKPNVFNFKDYIIIGTTNIILLPENKISFLIQDVLNIRSKEEVVVLETLTIGLSFKFNKKFSKK